MRAFNFLLPGRLEVIVHFRERFFKRTLSFTETQAEENAPTVEPQLSERLLQIGEGRKLPSKDLYYWSLIEQSSQNASPILYLRYSARGQVSAGL